MSAEDIRFCKEAKSNNWSGTSVEYAAACLLASSILGLVGGLIDFSINFWCHASRLNCQERFLNCFFQTTKISCMFNTPLYARWTAVVCILAGYSYYLVVIITCAAKAFGCRCKCSNCCWQAILLMIISFIPLYLAMVLALPFLHCIIPRVRTVNVQPTNELPAQVTSEADQANPADEPNPLPVQVSSTVVVIDSPAAAPPPPLQQQQPDPVRVA
jgi:hypothetical protein